MTTSYADIQKISDKQVKKGSAEELTDIIYDTLFHNTKFPQFDCTKVTCQDVNRREKEIEFAYDGYKYVIKIERRKCYEI